VLYYGDQKPKDWQAANIQASGRWTRFEPVYRGESEGEIEVTLLGRHNVNNALAAYAVCRELGISRKVLQGSLATFAGVKRRQEWKGEAGGIEVIDDFAHHPTAVKETIAALKAAYPGRRLWAIFEPRSHTSRRRIFEQEFAETLRGADQVVIAGLHQPERIPETDRLSPASVVAEINQVCGSDRAVFIEDTKDIPSYVVQRARSGDVILVMSNGGFGGVQGKILEKLKG
jgi:UDP-N-acetylmuramate: L-alanyl-gamma-D-glutamyl-meso-diaminopimelate ligase